MKKIEEKFKLIELEVFSDTRGSLISLEQNKNIPFNIKRVYFIFNTKKDIPRGFHAHKKLEQILICVKGSCKIKIDDGTNIKIFDLLSPNIGLYIGTMVWREMFDFSENSVLLIIASDFYNPEEYIKSYDCFKIGLL
ncbi:MAG: FdtA/QdtA family cupin domain-containing protein [Endomicrobium sp.]|jgi:dTDP-4-dehydrorhamnose 3,5-epimerase-like enzyme|nr:FdtA/QdtA family cupin domain-containing protein [Endomicrobium sp.]